MNLKNQEIINLINVLDSMAEKEFPVNLTYRILENYDKLLKAYRIYEQAKSKIKTDEELLELLDIETKVDIEPINKQELIDSGVEIAPNQLYELKRIING